MDANEVTITIPLTISVRLGAAGPATATAAPSLPAPGAGVVEEAARPKAYYRGYTGYDPGFLGTDVPLPNLTEEQRRNAAKNSDAASGADAAVLPYTHFSLVMNRRRQLAYFTAVNIDGAQSIAVPRGTDKWFYDSRIAESEQIGEALYQRNALDRGHLVRRLDPDWGVDAQRGDDDSFHFTNCSPQHERFNEGKDLWAGLEDFILGRADARDRKVTVFTGPVLDENDPLYKGVRLPLAFWKVVIYARPSGELATAAYVLEQAKLIENLPGLEAAFDAGVFRVTIAHLQERTGVALDYLAPHELPLSANVLEAARDRVAVADSFANVVL